MLLCNMQGEVTRYLALSRRLRFKTMVRFTYCYKILNFYGETAGSIGYSLNAALQQVRRFSCSHHIISHIIGFSPHFRLAKMCITLRFEDTTLRHIFR
jgi:hypothetical protein